MKTWSISCFFIFLFGLTLLTGFELKNPDFQKVVTLPTFSLSQLRSYSLSYLSSEDFTENHPESFTVNDDSTSFQYQESFMIYNRSALKHPVGKISYRAIIDLKEEKIRYSTDSVLFLSYTKNRYSRYEPVNKPPITFSDWQQQWTGKQEKRYQFQITEAMEERLQDFITYIQQNQEEQVNTKKLEEW